MRTFFHTCVLIPDRRRWGLKLIKFLFQISIASFIFLASHADEKPTLPQDSLATICETQLGEFKSYFKSSRLPATCAKAKVLSPCQSVQGVPIFHVDKNSTIKEKAKNIFVLSLIHGDETPAGSLGRYWIERLESIDPRNNWRIIPIANPDGVRLKTRTNANGVDLNRNFPTLDWNEKAIANWKKEGSQKRRFPGSNPASEPEINCLVSHFEEFKPDFVMSIHTPLRVLDFDGPQVKPPIYNYLPWRRLGNFPGSLGRFLWVEKNIPVLTTELRSDLPLTSTPFEQLQDVMGELVHKRLKK